MAETKTVLTADQKKLLGWLAAIIAGVFIVQASMVALFHEEPPLKELKPYVALAGSVIIGWLCSVQVFKSITK